MCVCICLQEFSFFFHLFSSTYSWILSLFTGLSSLDVQSIPDLSSKSHSSFSVLPTHPHDSLFYGTICPRPILDFLCLLVLACRQWGFCLGLCSPGLILVMSSPHRNSLLQSVLWLDRPLWFLGLWDTSQQQPSGNFEMSRCITHIPWRVQRTPLVTQWGPGWRERAHEPAWTWGSAFLRLRVGCLGF